MRQELFHTYTRKKLKPVILFVDRELNLPGNIEISVNQSLKLQKTVNLNEGQQNRCVVVFTSAKDSIL